MPDGPAYQKLSWPAGYWPDPALPVDEPAHPAARTTIAADQQQFLALLAAPADLLAPLLLFSLVPGDPLRHYPALRPNANRPRQRTDGAG